MSVEAVDTVTSPATVSAADATTVSPQNLTVIYLLLVSAFGLFHSQNGARVFLSIVGVAAVFGMMWMLKKAREDQKALIWALGLVAGGAVGNLIDRVYYGVVTDFALLAAGKNEWPVFNVADIALVVGVGLMFLDIHGESKREKAEKDRVAKGFGFNRARDLLRDFEALRAMPEDTVEQIEAKAERLRTLTVEGAVSWTLARACDFYVAAFLLPKCAGGQYAGPDGLPRRGAETVPTSGAIWELLRGVSPFGPLFGAAANAAETARARKRLESAVSLAATVCWEWCRQKGDRLVLAVATADAPLLLDGTTGQKHAELLLEGLALLDGTPATNSAQLLEQLTRAALPPGPVLLIGTRPEGGPRDLGDFLAQGLRRPVAVVDVARLDEYDFYEEITPDDG